MLAKFLLAALVVLCSLLANPVQAGQALPPDVGDGHVAWFDITTTDLAHAKEFYGKLFTWTFAAMAGSDQAVEISVAGSKIGTLRVADGKLSPFNGVVYIQVSDVKATCAKARELGATIAPGFPFNLPDRRGAIALLLDPTGHPVGLYSRSPLPEVPKTTK